jgi:hypothetical protein
MVTTDSCGNKKKDDEVDVRVITQGRAKMRMEFKNGEILGQMPEGKMRKATYPPPKFDVSNQM